MPPKSKINRSDVLNVAFQLTQKKGINYINARNIAKELNCSTTPIFRVYSCMEELIDELIEKIYEYYTKKRFYLQILLFYGIMKSGKRVEHTAAGRL